MSLSRYAAEATGIADEIKRAYSGHRELFARVVAENPAHYTRFTQDEAERAVSFLRKTPAQQAKMLKGTDFPAESKMVIMAVAMANIASRALRFADGMEFTVGKGYRAATADTAREVLCMDFSLVRECDRIIKGILPPQRRMDPEDDYPSP